MEKGNKTKLIVNSYWHRTKRKHLLKHRTMKKAMLPEIKRRFCNLSNYFTKIYTQKGQPGVVTMLIVF